MTKQYKKAISLLEKMEEEYSFEPNLVDILKEGKEKIINSLKQNNTDAE